MVGYIKSVSALCLGRKLFLVLIDDKNQRSYLRCKTHGELNKLLHFIEVALHGMSSAQKARRSKRLNKKFKGWKEQRTS